MDTISLIHSAASPGVAPFRERARYYVLGLKWAGSPYAHHSIGSLISVTTHAYATVRGVPKRQAGEDFYLLDKVRKIGSVARHASGVVDIRARSSNRVPFGTGPTVERMVRGDSEPTFHDPRCFAAVRHFIGLLSRMAQTGEPLVESDCEPELWLALTRLGYHTGVATLCRRYTPPRLQNHVFTWFDGFRTLKLVHELRDVAWPDRTWDDVRRDAPFVKDIPSGDPAVQCQALFQLECA